MSIIVGDYLFQKLSALGVQHVLTQNQSTVFISSIQRNGQTLASSSFSSAISDRTLCYLASATVPRDLETCYNDAIRFLAYRPVVIIHELQSAMYTSTTAYTGTMEFAAATIINSPLTAVSQIDRTLSNLTYGRGRPVYIGLALAVAGLQINLPAQGVGYSGAFVGGAQNGKGQGNVSGGATDAAEAALAMSFIR